MDKTVVNVEITKCPLCGFNERDSDSRSSGPPAPFELVRCRDCGHHYTLISHSTEVSSLYEDGDYEVKDYRGTFVDRILMSEYSQVLRKIGAMLGHVGSMLDFGCGKGRFPWLAEQKGWKVMGIETSISRAAFARQSYGLTICNDYYESGQIAEEPFDVITMFHVLEHLPDPTTLLGALVDDNLRPEGLVVVEVPNYRSLQSWLAGDRWVHLDMPKHISHFSERQLLSLFAQLDLKPVRREYFSVHLGVLGMIQSLLTVCGYRGSLISDLKYRNTFLLMLAVACLSPLAFVVELTASWFGFGGVIRVYGRREDDAG